MVKKIVQKDFLQIFRHYFICIATVKVLQFLTFILDHLFLTNSTQMPSLNRYEKIKCKNCGTQTTKPNLARHKKSCSAGTLHCTQCPNFFTKSQNDVKYHNANSTAPQNLMSSSSVNFVIKSFPAFMLYVNTETLNMNHKWDSERAILMWRI